MNKNTVEEFHREWGLMAFKAFFAAFCCALLIGGALGICFGMFGRAECKGLVLITVAFMSIANFVVFLIVFYTGERRIRNRFVE